MSRDVKSEEPSAAIWMRDEPGARRGGLSREGIGETGVQVADADGFEAVSMRRIASELDAGTMSLYHYVRNKEELLSLMGDAVMAEMLIPDEELPSNWRTALTAIARRTRAAFQRHPWILDALSESVMSGPSGLRHFEQSMAAVSELRVLSRRKLELIAQVDDYVFGFVIREILQGRQTEGGDPDLTEPALDFFEAQMETGEFPEVRKLLRGDARQALVRLMETFSGKEANDRRFERGLRIMLDGIEQSMRKKGR
jgi:AcrR family transcriptional regulator